MTKLTRDLFLILLLTTTALVFSQQGVPVADLNLSRDSESLRLDGYATFVEDSGGAMMLTDVGHDTCVAAIDRIRIQFNERDTRMDNGTRVTHTVSAGLVTAGNRSVLELLGIADKALAVAKVEGYNTVVSEQRLGPQASGVSPTGLT